jgi:hypothetical protein
MGDVLERPVILLAGGHAYHQPLIALDDPQIVDDEAVVERDCCVRFQLFLALRENSHLCNFHIKIFNYYFF